MKFIADLHIHSKYSRATSGNMTVEGITKAAKIKGIKLVGTSDFTHPLWLKELKSKLVEAGNGIYKYDDVYFILEVEVSNVYTKNGRLRKIHNIIYTPSFKDIEKINKYLSRFGNLEADGRPTLGLDSESMVEGILSLSPDSFIVPAHIWTPWFSLFGSNSGFDSIEECYGKYSEEIFAAETGLSSDPPMNWRLSSLDRITLVSNSDAHSPKKLGREANVFDAPLSFYEIKDILKTKDRKRFLYTIEFFPEEGKYHYDGHRKCVVRLSPKEAILNNNICPVCGKGLTLGVLHRVEELADREEGFIPPNAIPYKHAVPLEEIISEVTGYGKESMMVKKIYEHLTNVFEGEFNVLLEVPIKDIERESDERVAKGVEKMRKGKVHVEPGYDGVFGVVRISKDEEPETEEKGQLSLF